MKQLLLPLLFLFLFDEVTAQQTSTGNSSSTTKKFDKDTEDFLNELDSLGLLDEKPVAEKVNIPEDFCGQLIAIAKICSERALKNYEVGNAKSGFLEKDVSIHLKGSRQSITKPTISGRRSFFAQFDKGDSQFELIDKVEELRLKVKACLPNNWVEKKITEKLPDFIVNAEGNMEVLEKEVYQFQYTDGKSDASINVLSEMELIVKEKITDRSPYYVVIEISE